MSVLENLRRFASTPFATGALAVCLGAAVTLVLVRRVGRAAPVPASTSAPTTADFSPYIERIAVLIGSYDCGASELKGLPEGTRALIDSLRRATRIRGDSFSTIGVSIDGPLRKGEAWLQQFGEFDEVIVGRNWLNSFVVQHIWNDPAAAPKLPQLLLIEHRVTPTQQAMEVGKDSVVQRWVGAAALAPSLTAKRRE